MSACINTDRERPKNTIALLDNGEKVRYDATSSINDTTAEAWYEKNGFIYLGTGTYYTINNVDQKYIGNTSKQKFYRRK